MKQSLLLIGGMFATSISLFAQQTPVSQTPQNRNVVLEELTGIYCQYCPSGHEIANGLATSNPGRVVLVNVHAGGYAAPQAGAPDFRTADGNALDGFFNPTGYPAGSVQRTPHSSDMTRIATGRGNWSGQVNARLAEASPVNIAMDASIDGTTRVVTIHVEMFYTATQPAGTNHYLNVGILQNNVEGPQTNSGGWNPSAILPNGNYMHEHIFRGFVNAGGTWGEQIDATQTGVITKTITYTLPATVGNVPLNIGQLQFFAFLSEGHNAATTSKIITAAEVDPTLTNVPAANASAASGIVNNLATCNGGTVTPIIKITNNGDVITALNFSSSVNGGTAVPYSWTGNIAAYGTAEITIPALTVTAQGTNSVAVTITSVNGGSGVVGTVSSATKPILIAANTATSPTGVVKIVTDAWGSETTWKLYNSANTVVAQGGPYADHYDANGQAIVADYPQPDVNFTVVANECYKLAVADKYGDGFDSGYGNGKIEVLSGGTVVAGVVSFPSGKEKLDAFKASPTLSISEASAEIGMSVYPNPASGIVNVSFEGKGGDYSVSILDISGRTVATQVVSNASGSTNVEMPIATLQAGNYFVSVAQGGSSYTQKLMVK